jgi:sulfatase maturation enzyme AslB (radical SAM superfamily)
LSLLDTHAKIIDIKITFRCNNQCLFCAAGDKRMIYSDLPADKIHAALRAAGKGRNSALFTGGEPTLRDDLPDLVRFARGECGFKTVIIQTNGRRFAYRDYAELLSDAGADQFMVSIHGHTGMLHDYLTGGNGSFAETVLGIRNLISAGRTVATNTVITKSNFRNLPDIARMLCALGVGQMQFAFPHIDGKAKANAARVVPPMTLVIPYLFRALDTAEAAGRVSLTEGFPLCMIQGHEHQAVETLHKKIKVIDDSGDIEDFDGHRATRLKEKGADCPGCRHFKFCEGPWADYPAMFSWKEFKPVE